MSTHTPGPWVVNAQQVYGNGFLIASVNGTGHNWQADRDLIAAAPDLLAALNAVRIWMKNIDRRPTEEPLYNTVRAAIAKAEGTS